MTLRSGPGTNYSDDAYIPRNRSIQNCQTFTGYGDAWQTWLKVTTDGHTGYVMARYISHHPNWGAEGDDVMLAEVVTESTSLNVRQSPSDKSTKIGTVGKGQNVVVIDKTSIDGWYRVATLVGTGWCASKYLATRG